jgi:oligoribonuclease
MLGCFLDIETSGLDPFVNDPLEVAFVIVDLVTGKAIASYETFLQVTDEEWGRSDPESLLVHGITRKDLLLGKSRQEVSREIEKIFLTHSINNDRAFFICQNPSFDRPFFSKILSPDRQRSINLPYHWLDLASMYWAKRLVLEQKQKEFCLEITKNSIARAFSLPEEARPHRAMNGVLHLLLCYRHLIGFSG